LSNFPDYDDAARSWLALVNEGESLMLDMRDHRVEDYAALRDMDTTDVRVLTGDDRACLDELGRYLVATDAWQRFAIWLLHKHFEPDAGEVFVEHVMTGPRRTETTPIERSAFPALELRATALRFDPAVDSGVGVIGMEFARPDDFGCTPPLSADDETVLAGIAERLAANGKTERFGVRLIRDTLAMSEDELILETCDIARRTLHCEVTERAGTLAAKSVETSWLWAPVPREDGRAVMQRCYSGCMSDENGHSSEGHSP
jgi:hypothetical protein